MKNNWWEKVGDQKINGGKKTVIKMKGQER